MVEEEIIQILINQWSLPEAAVRHFMKELLANDVSASGPKSLDQIRNACATFLLENVLSETQGNSLKSIS